MGIFFKNINTIINNINNNLNNNFSAFNEGLGIMVFGMAGIFVVLLLIYASIKILLRVFPPKAES